MVDRFALTANSHHEREAALSEEGTVSLYIAIVAALVGDIAVMTGLPRCLIWERFCE